MLLQFSKPEIINSLENFNNSLICFIAVPTVGSYFVIIYCSGAQVQELNICVDSTGMGSDDGRTSWLPTWVTALPKSFPSLMAVTARFCRCHCHGHQSGPSSQSCHVGAFWHPGLPRRGCVPDCQASCSLLGLRALRPEPPSGSAACCLYCSHTCFIVPSRFTYKFGDKIIMNSR